jgi:hypothetical protein
MCRVRRVAPPRSPSPRGGAAEEGGGTRQPYRRTGEDWADPWMRSKEEKPRGEIFFLSFLKVWWHAATLFFHIRVPSCPHGFRSVEGSCQECPGQCTVHFCPDVLSYEQSNVVDAGCLSWVPDANFFSSRISDPQQRK